MKMEWTPQETKLSEILTLLRESQSTDAAILQNIQLELEKCKRYPDFNNYLMFVFTKAVREDEPIRSLSGFILKNNIDKLISVPSDFSFIKQECLQAVSSPSPLIRETVGILIKMMVRRTEWPELLPSLYLMLESQDHNISEGAFATLQKICEAFARMLDEDVTRPLDILIPKCLYFFNHSSSKIRSYAIDCINQIIILIPSRTIRYHIDSVLTNLLQVANDDDFEVRKNVCAAFHRLFRVYMDRLIPHVRYVTEYMLAHMQASSECAALDACEYWSSLAEQPIGREILGPHLNSLIPLLVRGMKHSNLDIIGLEEGKIVSRMSWNFRNCSAAALDIIADVFSDELLPIIVPILKETLFRTDDWAIKESGILALGAVAKGCKKGIKVHLPEWIPYLINCLNDEKASVRETTCWTLRCYSEWIISQPHDSYLKPFITELRKRILDIDNSVKVAADAAFYTLRSSGLHESYFPIEIRERLGIYTTNPYNSIIWVDSF